MEILKTNKKGNKLCLDGFMYVVKVQLPVKIRWECWKRKGYGCPGTLTTDLKQQNPMIGKEHNHGEENTGIKIVKAKNQMKEKAKSSSEKPANIVSETLELADERTRANFPKDETVKRMIRRQRDPEFPPVPENVSALNIPDASPWAKTRGDNPERFKFYDNGPDTNCRIIAYSSDEQLRWAARARLWFMDGNFKMSPPGFKQLYVIHASIGECSVPVVFAFLERKNQSVYEELFQAINAKLGDMNLEANPDKIICDFESGKLPAINSEYGDVEVHCCFYHLCQSTWRKIQDLELVNGYKDDDYFRLLFGQLDRIAVLPLDDVQDGFDL